MVNPRGLAGNVEEEGGLEEEKELTEIQEGSKQLTQTVP